MTALTLAALSGGCLVTTTPEFDEPEPSAPQLVTDRADPDPRGFVVLDAATRARDFATFVQSEDAGRPLEVRLLLDYGWPNDLERPFRLASPGANLDPSTLEEGPRAVGVTWTQGTLPMQPGCHRLTLMVAHEFDDGGTGCPTSTDDYDQISWLVLKCDELGCPEIDLSRTKQSEDDPACPPLEATCGADEALDGVGLP